MYFLYSCNSFDFNYKITIKQFGLKIHSLNSKQREHIIHRYKSIYEKRNKINRALNKNEDGEIRFDYQKRKEIENDEDLKYLIYMIRQERIKPVFHKNLESLLNNILVLEIDSSKLSKYIDNNDFRIFIHQFIDFHYIFDSDLKSRKNENEVSLPYQMRKMYRLKKNPDFEDLVNEFLIKYIFNFNNQSSYGCIFVNESFERYLTIVCKFCNSISSDELFKFIEILEMLFTNSRLSQNNILNDTLIIESLLIKKESNNIEKEFVLKTGIIYKYSKLEKNYTNEDLSTILHYIYDVRSIIIHGSLEKIFDCYNKLSLKCKSFICPKFDSVSKMQKKISILKFTESISYKFVKIVLLYWINNNEKISFLKNN